MLDHLQLGAEIQVENKIARRCSYEEMVHEEQNNSEFGLTDLNNSYLTSDDLNHKSLLTTSMENLASLSNEDLTKQCLLKSTQWAMILQEIFDERELSASVPILMNQKCLCQKASSICQRLYRLENALQNCLIEVDDDPPSNEDLIQILEEAQSALRAGVSIQVLFLRFYVKSGFHSVEILQFNCHSDFT